MQTPFKTETTIDDVDPEVKSYISQVLMDLAPFTTAETLIVVTAKDPLKLISQFEADGVEYEKTKLKSMHRISISLSEDGAKVEEEGLHEDIFAAICQAKDKLVKTLSEIQDNVISNQDRHIQINEALKAGNIH